MLPPPPLKSAPRYPVTFGFGFAALAVSGWWWTGGNIDGFSVDPRVWQKAELWRAFTSTLPHLGLLHLGFNLYWLWIFGTVVEGVYGPWKTLGIYVLLGFGSGLTEFAFFTGGYGLSGVVYGLWGMLWALGRHGTRFAGALDSATNRMFVIWFFICIALTLTGSMLVANAAHGSGAVMGVLLGFAAGNKEAVRWQCGAGLAALLILVVAASTAWWPWVNLSGKAEPAVEQVGVEAFNQGDFPRAVHWFEVSAHLRDASGQAWYKLGAAYQRLNQNAKALAAFEHAAQMPDAPDGSKEAANELRKNMAKRAKE